MSRRFSRMVLKEGHQEDFTKAVIETGAIANGALGWSGMADMFDMIGFPQHINQHFGVKNVTGNKRQRRKKLKKMLKQAFLSKIMDHVERLE